MNAKILLLVAACYVLVQGKSLDSSKLKRDLLVRALSNLHGENSKRFWDTLWSPHSPSGPRTKTEAIEEIQRILEELSGILNVFKEHASTTASTTGSTATTGETEGTTTFSWEDIWNLFGETTTQTTASNTQTHSTTESTTTAAENTDGTTFSWDDFWDWFGDETSTQATVSTTESQSTVESSSTTQFSAPVKRTKQLIRSQLARILKEVLAEKTQFGH